MAGSRRLILSGLLVVLAIFVVRALPRVFVASRFAVDVEIPASRRRALACWRGSISCRRLHGSRGCRPAIPVPALHAAIPRRPDGAAADARRRGRRSGDGRFRRPGVSSLSIPWLWMPLVMWWPPFSEGIAGGNVQIAISRRSSTCSCAGQARRGRHARATSATQRRAARWSAAWPPWIGAAEVSQPHAWVDAVRDIDRVAAIACLVVAELVTAATLLLAGHGSLAGAGSSLRLASDPAWAAGGYALVTASAARSRAGDRCRLPGSWAVRASAFGRRLDRASIRDRHPFLAHLRAVAPASGDADHPS